MRSVAVIGDAFDQSAWSGIPYHFCRTGARVGFITGSVRMQLDRVAWPRRFWAISRVASGRRPAGYQYSTAFLEWAEKQIPTELLTGEIISFSQHFPRAATVRRVGGRISYYIDATFAAMSSGRGLDLRLPPNVIAEACDLERENYALADRVVTMARWTTESVIAECGVPREKVFTVLPGANLEMPDGWVLSKRSARQPGQDRPFVLGFIGTDWRRKGLLLLCDIRDELAARGWNVVVRAIGEAPRSFSRRPGVEFLGFIDKTRELDKFVEFLSSCDVGCLFSEREALGISTLEFLRLGVPVAGFAVEGPADTLPNDAGFRFGVDTSAIDIAKEFSAVLTQPNRLRQLSDCASAWSPIVTWERCVGELQRIWKGAAVDCPARPWLGLPETISTRVSVS